MTAEEWREIPGYEGEYEVSSHGRVFSMARWVRCAHGGRRRVPPRMLRPGTINRFGHVSVALGKGNSQCVHNLVLLAFVGPRPKGCEARHLDTDATNNRLSNLKWGTKSENSLDAQWAKGKYVTDAEVRDIRSSKDDALTLAKRYGVTRSWIYAVQSGKRRSAA